VAEYLCIINESWGKDDMVEARMMGQGHKAPDLEKGMSHGAGTSSVPEMVGWRR